MSFIKKNWGLKVFVFGIVFSCGISHSMAGDDTPVDNAGQDANIKVTAESAESFKTEGSFSLGYNVVSTEDSLKAAEYIYPDSSLYLGLNLLSVPLPFRYHVNGELLSKRDYYLDGGFAYKDLILFRNILNSVQHNLNHYNYQLGDIYHQESLSDAAAEYYTEFVSNLVSLRLKAPDYPFHTFVIHRHVKREAEIQQRFLNAVKNSVSRDIDWKSDAVKLGANSHLGPVEVEYTYDYAKFNPGPNNVLSDLYTYPYDPPPRPNGIYPHNTVPETESSAHTIKLHSSYTGGIVAAASFSNLFQKNNFSLAETTTWKGALDFSWIPAPPLGFFFKYRHKDVDKDTPANVYLVGYTGDRSYFDSLPPVRQGISYDKDVFSLSSRYKPLKLLTLNADYKFSHLKRKDTGDWEALSDRTSIHTVNLAAKARPVDKIRLKAKYEYKNYDQPSYNTTPDISNKLLLATTYTPSPLLNIYLEYMLNLTERDNLRYLLSGGDPSPPLEIGGREGRGDQILASLSAAISPKASLTFSWFYQRWDVDHDVIYGKWPIANVPQYLLDASVPYTDEANSFSLALSWVPRDDITVGADLSYTITEGTTGYNAVFEGVPLATLSNLEAEETSFSLAVAKKLPEDWEVGISLFFNIYNDKPTDLLDGNALATTFTMKRYF